MIKGLFYSKSLKRSLTGFLISCFILLGGSFVNGLGAYTTVGVNSSSSAVNGNYDITFLKGGGLLTNYIGQGKGILALDNQVLFWWLPDGLPYFYGVGRVSIQGYFPNFSYCSSMSSGGSYQEPIDCTENSIDESTTPLLKNFFNTVKAGDVVYYNLTTDGGAGRWWYGFKICWNSSQMGKSICFNTMYNYNNNAGVEGQQLINSRGYNNLTFANLPYSEIGYAPGQAGYLGQFSGNTEGSTEGNINSSITGDYVYYDCTWNDIIIALESEGYNKYVCYGGLDNFDLYDSSVNYNPIAGYGKTLNQIWAWSGSRAWDNFTDRFTFWNGIYKDNTNNYNAMWESYPAVYRTYFQLYNAYKGSMLDPRTVLEYCNIKQFTGNSLNNSAGGYFLTACETVVREKQTGIRQSRVDGTIYSGGVYNSDVPISVNWAGVSAMSGLNESKDGLNFIQDFFNKAKLVVPTDYSNNVGGSLPTYIIVFLLAIILFRFLSH